MHVLKSRSLVALVSAALAVVPTMLSAQATQRPTFGISGGAAIPVGDFSDAVNTGFNVAGHIGIKPGMSPVGLRFEGMYNQFDVKGSGNDLKAKILAGTANIVLMQAAAPGAVRPYFIGGLGVYNLKLSSDALNASSDSKTKFGLNGGAGIDMALSGLNVFVEGRYHHVFTKDTNAGVTTNTGFIPLVVGLRF